MHITVGGWDTYMAPLGPRRQQGVLVVSHWEQALAGPDEPEAGRDEEEVAAPEAERCAPRKLAIWDGVAVEGADRWRAEEVEKGLEEEEDDEEVRRDEGGETLRCWGPAPACARGR